MGRFAETYGYDDENVTAPAVSPAPTTATPAAPAQADIVGVGQPTAQPTMRERGQSFLETYGEEAAPPAPPPPPEKQNFLKFLKSSVVDQLVGGYYDQRASGKFKSAVDTAEDLAKLEAGKPRESEMVSFHGEKFRPRANEPTEADKPKLIAQAKAQIKEHLEEMKKYQEKGQEIPLSPETQEFLDTNSDKSVYEAFKAAPAKIILEIGARSGTAMLPGLAYGTVLGTAGSAVGPGGSAAGFGVGMGAGSARVEYASSLMTGLQQEGVDTSSPEALAEAVADSELMKRVEKFATTRAAIVGGMDAVAGLIGAKNLTPGLSSKLASELANAGLQMPIQGALGAAGEAGGQLATQGEVTNVRDVAAEFAGELVTAPVEVATAAHAGARAKQEVAAGEHARSPMRAMEHAADIARSEMAAKGADPLAQELAAADAAGAMAPHVAGELELGTFEREILQSDYEAQAKRSEEAQARLAEEDVGLGEVQGERRAESIMAAHAAYEKNKQEALEAAREPAPEELRRIAAERAFNRLESAAKQQKKVEIAAAEGERELQIAEKQAPAFEEAVAVGEVQARAKEQARPTLGDLMPTEVRNLGKKIQAKVTAETPVMRVAPAVEPDELQAWAGKSKVVDEKGVPLTVYHGSTERGVANHLTPNGAREVSGAVFFTDNQDVAEQYRFPREHGEIISTEYNPDTEEDEEIPPGDLVKAHLRIENPMVVDMEGGVGDALRLSKYVREAKEKGHDGLILKNVDDSVGSTGELGTTYAVFDEKQIRKAGKKPRRAEVAPAPAAPPVKAAPESTVSDLDSAAHEAATSPQNKLPEPTEAQKKAGNYKKGHVTVQGLDIAIENPVGSERTFKRPNGETGANTMKDHYGYIKRTEGADGDQVDVFVGDQPDSPNVFVIDQIDQRTGAFDEHKAMVGYPNQFAAIRAYRRNYEAGFKVGPVTEMSMDQFKGWVKEGNLKAPLKRINVEKMRIPIPASGLQVQEAQEASNRRAPRRSRVRFNLEAKPAAKSEIVTLDKAQKTLAPLLDAMPAIRDRIDILEDDMAAPDNVRAEIRKLDPLGRANFKGMHDVANKRIYIFARNHRNSEDLVKTLLHEAVGHMGIKAVLGDNYAGMMRDVFQNAANPDVLQKIADEYKIDMESPAGQVELADEYIARMAEENFDAGILQRVIDAVRAALRKVGVVREWTNDDIRALLRDSRKMLRGKPLSSVKITTEAEIAETGELVDLEENAETAIRQIRKRLEVVKKLRGCL